MTITGGDISAVFFDLDGTLLDTAADMAGALNAILVFHGRDALPFETVRPHVSKGGMALVKLGFGIDGDDARAKSLYDELLIHYRKNLFAGTKLFPGMANLLQRIEKSARRWGVITNKPGFLTEPLMRGMKLNARSACTISGDTLEKRKPHPDQLIHACELIGVDAARAIYIGDDARDIEAGRGAGMRTIAAAYGYIAPGENPHDWGADTVVAHVDEIWEWVAARVL